MSKKEKEGKKRSGYRWEAEQMLLGSKNINEALIEKITEKIKSMGGLYPRETCFEVMRKLKIDTEPFRKKQARKGKVEKKGKGTSKSAKKRKSGKLKRSVKKKKNEEVVAETDVEDEFPVKEAEAMEEGNNV